MLPSLEHEKRDCVCVMCACHRANVSFVFAYIFFAISVIETRTCAKRHYKTKQKLQINIDSTTKNDDSTYFK